MLLRQALDQVNLRSHGKLAAWSAFLNLPDYKFGRSHRIRQLTYIPAAFRVGNNMNAGIIFPCPFHMLRQKALMHRTMPFPQNDARAPDFVFGLAKRLHDALLPPLEPMRKPTVFRAPSLPRAPERHYVIVPATGFPAPAAASHPLSFFATPELLHLFVHYVFPFLSWYLPPEFRRLGFVEPTPREFARCCALFIQDGFLRHPGFAHLDTGVPRAMVALSRQCLPRLLNNEIPPPAGEEALRILREPRMRCERYYTHEFGRLYRQAREQWDVLEELEDRLSEATSRRSSTQ